MLVVPFHPSDCIGLGALGKARSSLLDVDPRCCTNEICMGLLVSLGSNRKQLSCY